MRGSIGFILFCFLFKSKSVAYITAHSLWQNIPQTCITLSKLYWHVIGKYLLNSPAGHARVKTLKFKKVSKQKWMKHHCWKKAESYWNQGMLSLVYFCYITGFLGFHQHSSKPIKVHWWILFYWIHCLF